MDNQYVAQAQAAYQARDFQAASQAYVQLLQDPSVPKGPGDLGYLYHQLGNCLLQLKDFDSAIESYTQATADSAYDAVGAFSSMITKTPCLILKSPPPMPNTTLLTRPIWAWAMRF